ncbi:hypothetical protein H4218_000018 [Coemansia sp. IMI 209128]|nr:hypothetical protein H4218_000018 [Coemansia sp. IMI 209128]
MRIGTVAIFAALLSGANAWHQNLIGWRASGAPCIVASGDGTEWLARLGVLCPPDWEDQLAGSLVGKRQVYPPRATRPSNEVAAEHTSSALPARPTPSPPTAWYDRLIAWTPGELPWEAVAHGAAKWVSWLGELRLPSWGGQSGESATGLRLSRRNETAKATPMPTVDSPTEPSSIAPTAWPTVTTQYWPLPRGYPHFCEPATVTAPCPATATQPAYPTVAAQLAELEVDGAPAVTFEGLGPFADLTWAVVAAVALTFTFVNAMFYGLAAKSAKGKGSPPSKYVHVNQGKLEELLSVLLTGPSDDRRRRALVAAAGDTLLARTIAKLSSDDSVDGPAPSTDNVQPNAPANNPELPAPTNDVELPAPEARPTTQPAAAQPAAVQIAAVKPAAAQPATPASTQLSARPSAPPSAPSTNGSTASDTKTGTSNGTDGALTGAEKPDNVADDPPHRRIGKPGIPLKAKGQVPLPPDSLVVDAQRSRSKKTATRTEEHADAKVAVAAKSVGKNGLIVTEARIMSFPPSSIVLDPNGSVIPPFKATESKVPVSPVDDMAKVPASPIDSTANERVNADARSNVGALPPPCPIQPSPAPRATKSDKGKEVDQSNKDPSDIIVTTIEDVLALYDRMTPRQRALFVKKVERGKKARASLSDGEDTVGDGPSHMVAVWDLHDRLFSMPGYEQIRVMNQIYEREKPTTKAPAAGPQRIDTPRDGAPRSNASRDDESGSDIDISVGRLLDLYDRMDAMAQLVFVDQLIANSQGPLTAPKNRMEASVENGLYHYFQLSLEDQLAFTDKALNENRVRTEAPEVKPAKAIAPMTLSTEPLVDEETDDDL